MRPGKSGSETVKKVFPVPAVAFPEKFPQLRQPAGGDDAPRAASPRKTPATDAMKPVSGFLFSGAVPSAGRTAYRTAYRTVGTPLPEPLAGTRLPDATARPDKAPQGMNSGARFPIKTYGRSRLSGTAIRRPHRIPTAR